MTAADLVARMVYLGVALVPLDGERVKWVGPTGVMTDRLRELLRLRKLEVLTILRGWDERLAVRLLRDMLVRVATEYRPAWRDVVADASWMEHEARIEAAALTKDTPAFIKALVEYEQAARRTFAMRARREVEIGRPGRN